MKTFWIVTCMLFSGIGLGWLIGMSMSPVLHIVVAGVVSLIVGITGVLAGIRFNEKRESRGSSRIAKTNPLPITFVIIGIAFGSFLGVKARTHNWLGRDPGDIIQKCERYGLNKNRIAETLFENEFGAVNLNSDITYSKKASVAGLFKLPTEDCSELEGHHGEELRSRLKDVFNNERSSIFFESLDSLSLENFKEMICSEK